jgi:hypothetical protein
MGRTVSLASLFAAWIFPYHTERRMCRRPRSKSMSPHCKPRASPARRPSIVKMQNSVRQGSSATARIRWSCSTVKDGASYFTPRAGKRRCSSFIGSQV